MKHYIIGLLPEASAEKAIENLRRQYTKSALVDGLPPHVTLKSRFALQEGIVEDDLKKAFDTVNMYDTSIVFGMAEVLGGAFVLRGSSDQVKKMHYEIGALLVNIAVDLRPEFEGDQYKIHLTLLREGDVEVTPHLGEMLFDRICLYEIDPTQQRAFAHRIACKKLLPRV